MTEPPPQSPVQKAQSAWDEHPKRPKNASPTKKSLPKKQKAKSFKSKKQARKAGKKWSAARRNKFNRNGKTVQQCILLTVNAYGAKQGVTPNQIKKCLNNNNIMISDLVLKKSLKKMLTKKVLAHTKGTNGTAFEFSTEPDFFKFDMFFGSLSIISHRVSMGRVFSHNIIRFIKVLYWIIFSFLVWKVFWLRFGIEICGFLILYMLMRMMGYLGIYIPTIIDVWNSEPIDSLPNKFKTLISDTMMMTL